MSASYSEKVVWKLGFKEAVDFLLKRFKIVNVKFSGISTKSCTKCSLKLRSKGKQIPLFRPQMVFPLVVFLRMGISPF